MTLTQLHYMITISKTKSFNKAAEALYVSQPSLTSAIRELEKEIGITIFNRGGRGVTLTNDGAEFLQYALQVYSQYEMLEEKYIRKVDLRKKFSVSTQHYSFAVKAFVNMVRSLDTSEYDLAIKETRTREVIEDVRNLRSEIGLLYESNFNRKAIEKTLKSAGLEFHRLIECKPYVYMWKGHPLAGEKSIRFEQLGEYPCLAFEQGDSSNYYFAEEILSTNHYEHIIHCNDRATILNLMVGLNGYTLCSGIICEELNGNDYVAVPFEPDEKDGGDIMEIGYITRKNIILSNVGRRYVEELKKYLGLPGDGEEGVV